MLASSITGDCIGVYAPARFQEREGMHSQPHGVVFMLRHLHLFFSHTGPTFGPPGQSRLFRLARTVPCRPFLVVLMGCGRTDSCSGPRHSRICRWIWRCLVPVSSW